MKPLTTHVFTSDISAIALSENNDFAVIALWDAPLYSLIVLNITTMKAIAKTSAAWLLDAYPFSKFVQNMKIKQDKSLDSLEDETMMEIDTTAESNLFGTLNTVYPVNAITSMQIISFREQENVICGLSDGKILQLSLDIALATRIISEPDTFAPQLNI